MAHKKSGLLGFLWCRENHVESNRTSPVVFAILRLGKGSVEKGSVFPKKEPHESNRSNRPCALRCPRRCAKTFGDGSRFRQEPDRRLMSTETETGPNRPPPNTSSRQLFSALINQVITRCRGGMAAQGSNPQKRGRGERFTAAPGRWFPE